MNVWQQWQQFSTEAAKPAVALSAAERVALQWGAGATPLGGRWDAMLETLPDIGRLRWRVDNCLGSLEVASSLDEVDATNRTAIARGPGIELRLLLSRWAWAFAVDEAPHRGLRSSLRFFDGPGRELLRANLVADSDYVPYARMLSAFRNPALPWTVEVEAPPSRADARQRGAVSAAALTQAWSRQKRSSDTFRLLREFGLRRPALYPHLEGVWTWRLEPRGVTRLLESLAQREVPFALSLANRGAILAHRGIVERVCSAGNALCILDPGVRMELNLSRVREAWVVERPSLLGPRTVVELLDEQGDVIVSLRDVRAEVEGPDLRFESTLAEAR